MGEDCQGDPPTMAEMLGEYEAQPWSWGAPDNDDVNEWKPPPEVRRMRQDIVSRMDEVVRHSRGYGRLDGERSAAHYEALRQELSMLDEAIAKARPREWPTRLVIAWP